MKKVRVFSGAALAMIIAGTAVAQPGGFRPGEEQERFRSPRTGQRMGPPHEMISQLFDRADTDGDGKVTKQELIVAMEQGGPMRGQERGEVGEGRRPRGPGGFGRGPRAFGRGPGGPGRPERGPGRPGGRGPDGPEFHGDGGPGAHGPGRGQGPGRVDGPGPGRRGEPRMGGPRPEPGELLPAFLVEELGLDEQQRSKLEALQADVKSELDSILTDEQKEQLIAHRGRRGHGPGHGEGRHGPGGERGERDQRPDRESKRPNRPSRPE